MILSHQNKLFLVTALLIQTGQAFSNTEYVDRAYNDRNRTGLFLERATYEEYVYSRGRKTELGDQTEIEAALRYQYDERTYGRLRFETDPLENRFDNKTSRFEIVGGHHYKNFAIRVDTEINTNDGGGQSIGLDLDSRGTFLSYQADNGIGLVFYPFNIDTQVGREYNSYDVSRLYFIDGSPTNVNNTQLEEEKIAEKTIPGLELNYRPSALPGWRAYLGAGLATYLYPVNADFDIQTNRAADRWERKESFGYKLGVVFRHPDYMNPTIFNLQFAGHNRAEETGSLLAQAASLNGRTIWNEWFIDGEVSYSKAGKKPYNLSRTSDWFEQTAPFQPVYSDFFGATQDWVDKSDTAFALKLGRRFNDFLPYGFVRYQGKNFIFRDRESAHLLRTADERASHGGLTRLGIGAYQKYGNFSINPEFEWLSAKNPVFGNSADVRSDRILSTFRKQDFLLYLVVSYNFDGNLFRFY